MSRHFNLIALIKTLRKTQSIRDCSWKKKICVIVTVSVILPFSQPMEPYLDLQEVLGPREKEGTLVPEEIRVRFKQNRGNNAYISE